MTSPLYSRDILRLAASIPHLGRLDGGVSVEKRSPVCGSRVTVDVVLDDGGRVAALGQEVHACALGQASAALMGAHAIGRNAAELAAARDALAAWLAGRRATIRRLARPRHLRARAAASRRATPSILLRLRGGGRGRGAAAREAARHDGARGAGARRIAAARRR